MSNYSIFSVIGIEIEYMLVDKTSLNVQPKSDIILKQLAGELVNETNLDDIAVSNELVLHVLELKNNGPRPLTEPLAEHFQKAITTINPILAEHHLQLLPTGAHPWMNPLQETKRWPHGNNDIYQQFDKIFNCKGHGWSNLQSMHINLPFANDTEFNQLHNAIRLLLPLLPALAASTPFLEGAVTGIKDTRLDFYGSNQRKIPAISGDIIPEFISSEAEYQQKILQPMYDAISLYDEQKILQHEWLNSRAAIPKFKHKAIEIRILDTQECVTADIAIAKAVFYILKQWINQSHYFLDNPYPTKNLKALYDQTKVNGLTTIIDNRELLSQWQLKQAVSTCRDVWCQLIEQISHQLDEGSQRALEYILSQGNLSERLLKASGPKLSQSALMSIYRQLSHCLLTNQQFNPS
ncbi:Glutamate--cysteine ligase, GCS2 [Legionella beliardensis]|uniref:Glutamate--cysteine ligase, GCS2 n=1 Tax=Legionella beliardensis TaxID=91822 RepID=A0A378HY33_9GAMM|nr:glutamate-cysteine ligase family protein [Legionella beliardensis]STX27799.1 Glutamate--cysteine ligase, GCS2 [Legionella beliardensis]